MNDKLSDLVSLLFAELGTITNSKLSGDKLKEARERSQTVVNISKVIIEAGRLGLDAKRARPDMLESDVLPKMLDLDK